MAIRRKVRKLEHAHSASFDDQLWPVNVTLVILGGFVAGVIIALSSFSDPRVLYNGWARLATLAASVGFLIWLASRPFSLKMRRRLQLAAVLSMLIHCVLMVVLYNQRLAYLSELEEEQADVAVLEEEPVTIPEYHVRSPETVYEEHERPVETETPEETKQQPVERDEPRPVEKPSEPQPTPVPGTTPQVQPSSVQLREVEQAAPRRADTSSQLSRQSAKVAPQKNEPIAEPKVAMQPQPDPKPIEAQVKVDRQSAEVTPVDRRDSTSEPVLAPQQQATQITRRSVQQPEQTQPSSAPQLTRAISKPSLVPKAAAETPEAVAQAKAEPAAEMQPSTSIARQQTTGPRVAMQPSPTPQPQKSITAGAPELARLESPQTANSEQPQVTSQSSTRPARTAQSATATDATAADSPSVATGSNAESPASQPAPTATAVARTNTASPVTNTATAPGAAEAAGAAPQVSSASVERAQDASQPSLNPTAAPAARVARAAQTARAEASPVNVDSPAVTASSAPASPSVEATRTALAKGTAGVAGSGQEQNFDRGLTVARSPATAAAASATRARASQTTDAGPAVSPSAPALIAKSTAGANVPTAAMAAADVPSPDVAGTARPSSIEASSSAAVQRASASAPRGTTTAAAGTSSVDIGPTQVVATVVGASPAAGGGSPTVQLSKQGPQIARSAVGGSPLAALAAAKPAAAPEAPAASGGGAPATPGQPGPAVAAATRGAAGGVDAPKGAPSPAVASGPAAQVAAVEVARASSGAEGAPGPTVAGGGGLPRRGAGRPLASDLKAQVAQIPTGPETGGTPAEASLDATGGKATRAATGSPTSARSGEAGALAGAAAVDTPTVVSPGAGVSSLRGDPQSDPGPKVASVAAAGPIRRSMRAGLPSGVAAAIDEPELSAGASGTPQDVPGELKVAGEVGPLTRGTSALPVQVAAMSGPGGLGSQPAPDVGSLSRRAQRDSEVIHAGTSRFIGRKVGGPLAIDGTAREAADAYQARGGLRIGKSPGPGMPSERTEVAVEAGLEFLARHQSTDGSWSLHNFGAGRAGYEQEKAIFQADTAATGLALLAFLGAGYDHFDDQYRSVVRGGIDFLLKNQQPAGDLYVTQDAESNKSAWLYSHAIATIALCEAYGMTGDDVLREPAQKAVDFIVSAQDNKQGGWRYTPQYASDTSVTGWQVMALKSAELAGLKVPDKTYEGVRRWLVIAQGSPGDNSQFVYNPQAADTPQQRHGRRPTPAMNAVGLLMQMYLGSNRDDDHMIRGAETILDNLPAMGTPAQPQRDTYYWYYATQVMFHMKGKYWKTWNERLHPLLADRQIQSGPLAGSWDPLGPIPDRWGPQAGRIYVTAMNILSLEVYYRHLPIYESTAQ